MWDGAVCCVVAVGAEGVRCGIALRCDGGGLAPCVACVLVCVVACFDVGQGGEKGVYAGVLGRQRGSEACGCAFPDVTVLVDTAASLVLASVSGTLDNV